MAIAPAPALLPVCRGLLARLAASRAGNTLAMVAASVIPLLALIGGGVDMGRSYLSQTRLQQACDAGVLAARKKLGSDLVTDGVLPTDVDEIGQRFFDLNFRDGAYGTADLGFVLALEKDNSISGRGTVNVPTTIMNLFGYTAMPIQVNCTARLNFSNTDIMMVLDTTGSMAQRAGGSETKIEALRRVVKAFHKQVEDAAAAETVIRYGFVPYSTNVNVGHLLKSDWVVDSWKYHGREVISQGEVARPVFKTERTQQSGTAVQIAAYTAASCPADTDRWQEHFHTVQPDGTGTWSYTVNGTDYWCNRQSDGQWVVAGVTYTNFTYTDVRTITGSEMVPDLVWRYRQMDQALDMVKGATGDDPLRPASFTLPMDSLSEPGTPITIGFKGCMEERDTYNIDDYDDVDLSKALDLDIDLVPTPGDARTQWRPMLHEFSFIPQIWWNGSGKFQSPVDTRDGYINAGWAGLSACPAPARKLQAMDELELDTYLASLVAQGSTYHDIGMIWGGRLLSPTGLFSGENADVDGTPTSRHMIFLTDGETAPLDVSYGAYGIEPLDKRRWDPATDKPGFRLTDVVEKRFGVACSEVRKRNITVWVIGFGTKLNPVMTRCAGPGHSFEASDAAQLGEVFGKIATQLGDLRISG